MADGSTEEKKKRYILLVDKNVDDRFRTGMILQQFGYNICTANSAQEALDFMHVTSPAAIITEAGLTGSNLISRIKKDGRFSDVPLLFMTTEPDLDLELRARRGEIAACLRKPVEADALYQAIQASVEKTPRKNIRIAVALEAKLEGVEEHSEGLVTVISEFGMFFRTLEAQDLNAQLPVAIKFPERTISLVAAVLYSYSLEASPFNEPGMGMKFTKIKPEDQAFIKSYILKYVEGGLS
jgi:CheY-like chemotaxis protein